jgi:16S rRNA (uracil1498-N3)-methyltransferase
MHRFYVNEDQIHDDVISLTGTDVNHIKNVLRMKPGDEIIICNGQGKDCYCIIKTVSETIIEAEIQCVRKTDTELTSRITLFQGLPKSDKMELVIQKAVELGVFSVIPVMTARSIVKLEDKKREEKKLERWQAIAESAAKQSGRGQIPKIMPVIAYKEAVKQAGSMDLAVIPYENAKGMQLTKDIMGSLKRCATIGIIIGPEGGFEESEIELASANNIKPISLGRRILRTETAGFAVLSMMMLVLED